MLSRWFLLFFTFSCGSFAHASRFCTDINADPVQLTIPLSSDEIRAMIKHGRDGSRERIFRKSYMDFFARVLSSTSQALAPLSTTEALSYLSLFAQWRLLPPAPWSSDFFAKLEQELPSWSPKHFLAFAEQRKVSPLALPVSFHQTYLAIVKNSFLNFNPTTQLEVVSAELYHGLPWSIEELRFFINAITTSLKNDPRKLQIKSLKELYRALLFLPTSEQTLLNTEIAALTGQLEIKLQLYGLSLVSGGRSGSRHTHSSTRDPRFTSAVMALRQLFPPDHFLYEFFDFTIPGFFDPVDLLIAEHKIVVEWDGLHHYFRPLNEDGSLRERHEDLVLRPLDQSRDRQLRLLKYRILRISPVHARHLDDLDIETLLNEQNP